ncbi:uncharacterized protein LOC112450546 isoform X2 [Kryptolebias marmoratus]|nr:uncharacterized protein LOC112450546 isoform X2 [Kryptolebias marmoratus]
MKTTTDPAFEQGFSSRFAANFATEKSTLTILKTVKEDEALYHCAFSTWKTDQWIGTYLSLKENITKTVNYSVVQWPTVSGPVQPGDTVTLQCSILYDSLTWSCPSEHSVSWFVVRKDIVHGNAIYKDKNRPYKWDRKQDASSPSKSCIYHFSKNVTSSDSGTYYCALAMYEDVMFGNGAELEIEGASGLSIGVLQMNTSVLPLTWTILALSVLAILVTFIKTKSNSCRVSVCLQSNDGKQKVKREEDPQIYSTAIFTVIKNVSGGRKNANTTEKEKTFAAVMALEVE